MPAHPNNQDLKAAQSRITQFEREMCTECRKKFGLSPKITKKNDQGLPIFHDKLKNLRLMGLVAFYSALAFALFWGIWALCGKSVPWVGEIKWTNSYSWQLPFRFSRWTDILFAPLYSMLISSLFLYFRPYIITKFPKSKKDITFGLVIGLAAGLVGGLAAGLFAGLVGGLAAGLVIGLVIGLVGGLAAGLFAGLVGGLAAGLVIGLVGGLAAGLVIGLAAGLFAGLVGGLEWLGLKIKQSALWFGRFNKKIFRLE